MHVWRKKMRLLQWYLFDFVEVYFFFTTSKCYVVLGLHWLWKRSNHIVRFFTVSVWEKKCFNLKKICSGRNLFISLFQIWRVLVTKKRPYERVLFLCHTLVCKTSWLKRRVHRGNCIVAKTVNATQSWTEWKEKYSPRPSFRINASVSEL